ncbi:MAG: carboxypeptidase-like regulatory domain-containing protein [Acidobacteriota bacterium]
MSMLGGGGESGLWAWLVTIALFGSGFGQAGRSELTGIVRDGKGQVIAGAAILISRIDTNDTTTAKTGPDGSFTIPGLPPGEYRIEIESSGFQRLRQEGVRLTTGERIRLDLELSVGEFLTATVVRADASLLRTESSSLGQVIPPRTIVSLPLNGRNFFTLITLAPGVAAPPPGPAGPSLPRLNGGRPRVNEFLYDGISALQPEPGQVAFYPLIDDAGAVFDASVQTGPVASFPVADSFNRALERDVSTGDVPNVFAASQTIDLNFGKGARLRALRVGWRLSGMVIVQSGLPLAVTQLTNFNAFAGFGVQRPNLQRNPALPRRARSTRRWFDTEAFTIAPQFTLGTSSRNPVRGPGYRSFDLAIIKATRLGDSLDLEWRGEIFNLTNTPPLGNPNGIAGSGAFGTITTAGDPRVIQLALKILF